MSDQTQNKEPQEQPEIKIQVNNTLDANAHSWKVLAAILAFGAVGLFAYGLKQAGLAAIASTGTVATLSLFLQLMLKNGLIALPSAKSDDDRIEGGKNAARAMAAAVAAIIERSSVLRLALISVGYGVLFVLAHLFVQQVLETFGNPFLAMAVPALGAAVICAPTVFVGFLRKLKGSAAARKQA